nr:MAG TPA: hypothetical protein [Caudoviricetes sp.]
MELVFKSGDIVMSPELHGKKHFRVISTHAKLFLFVEEAKAGYRANIMMSDVILVNAVKRPFQKTKDAPLSVMVSKGMEEAIREYHMRLNARKDNYKVRLKA